MTSGLIPDEIPQCARCRMLHPDHTPGTENCHPEATQDSAILAGLFHRAILADLIRVRTFFEPSNRLSLEVGQPNPSLTEENNVELTADEIEAIRRIL